ncbi:phage tail tape measure protein, partial [Staphylococcus auricularis]
MKRVGRSAMIYLTTPLTLAFGAAGKASVNFDDSMRKVKATAGATGEDFNKLKDKALEMGKSTKFSASESAEGMNYMALAGWDTKEMLNGISGVMRLAAASGEDLASVSDIVTDNLTAFGMKAKESNHFADVLAQTSSKANTDVRGLGEAFKYAAPVAGSLGYSIEDTSTAIGLMSNAGIKGQKAGTSLRTMFNNLSKPTKAMKEKMTELGISITDSNGKMLPMREVLGQLREKMGGLSKSQQAAAASTIFGKEAMSGALAIVNASDEDYKKLTASIDDSKGAAKRMADEMEGGIGGSLREMKSAVESMAIALGDALAPVIEKVAGWVKKLADKFTQLSKPMQTVIGVAGIVAAAMGPLLITIGFLAQGIEGLGLAFKGLGSAFTLFTNPIGIAVAAIAALGTAFVIAYKKSETFRNIVHTVIDPVIEGIKRLWGNIKILFQGIKNLFQGNDDLGGKLLNKLFPPGVVEAISNTIDFIKEKFTSIFGAVSDFAHKIGETLSTFWEENGAQIIEALTNIKNFMQPIIEAIKNIVVGAMMIIWNIMKFIWPAIEWLIKSVWENVKGIISGALDVILGIVKIFSTLFTGDWKGLWDSIVQVLKGIVQVIWNLVQLWFVGKILKLFKVFGRFAVGIFRGIWKKVVSIFIKMKDGVVRIATVIKNGVSRVFTALKNTTVKIFTIVKNFLIKVWTTIKNKVVSLAQRLW